MVTEISSGMGEILEQNQSRPYGVIKARMRLENAPWTRGCPRSEIDPLGDTERVQRPNTRDRSLATNQSARFGDVVQRRPMRARDVE